VRVIAAGNALLTPSITRQLLDRRRLPAPVANGPEALAELTEREREVLERLDVHNVTIVAPAPDGVHISVHYMLMCTPSERVC